MAQRIPRDVDWQKFYAALERLGVSIPEQAEGDAVDLAMVARLLVRVQNNRAKLDSVVRKLDRSIAVLRRNITLKTEERRLRRLDARRSDEIMRLPNKEQRDAAVEDVVQIISAQIAILNARCDDYAAARASAEGMLKTLQTAKETLNSLKNIGLEDADASQSYHSR